MSNGNVTVEIAGGPSIAVPWAAGMTAHQALEAAFNYQGTQGAFTYGIQYYGSQWGYLVFMIDETYDTYMSASDPFFYWHFYVNGIASPTGIDQTKLNAGDVVQFAFEMYLPETHSGSLLEVKHKLKSRGS